MSPGGDDKSHRPRYASSKKVAAKTRKEDLALVRLAREAPAIM
jgi:hypothetical protein